MKRLSLAIFTLFVACSGLEDADPKGDQGSSYPSELIAQGLYQSPDESTEVAVWNSDTGGTEGLIVVGETAYWLLQRADGSGELRLWDDLSAVHDFTLNRDLATYTLSFAAPVAGLPSDLIMVPHDGFKPEFAPAPGVVLWTGVVVAANQGVEGEEFINGDCELTIEGGEITTFGCSGVGLDSPWTNEIPDSWSETETGAAFRTDAVHFEGVFIDENTWTGDVVAPNAWPSGRFTFSRD